MRESTFSFGKPLLGVILLVGAVAAIVWWVENREVVYTDEAGWSVSLPNGWDPKMVRGRLTANGYLKEGGVGLAFASLHPHGAGVPLWPEAGLNHFVGERQSHEETILDGRRAVVVIFLGSDGQRYVGAAIDRGDALVVYQIGCSDAAFEQNRGLFDRLARRMTCGTP